MKFPEHDHRALLSLFSHIDSTVQAQSRPYTLMMKDLYDPVNPDKDTVKVRQNLSVTRQEELLMGHLRPLLQKAKYEQVPEDEIKRLSEYVELPERGLQVKAAIDDYALAEIWVAVLAFCILIRKIKRI